MAFTKFIIPALAVAATAAAQCSQPTATIQNAGDATALASCTTFSGDIVIATGAADTIQLNGIQRLSGNLIANGATKLTTLSADSLAIIDKGFELTNLTILSTLAFPRLTMVDSIMWNALPNLQNLSFTSKVTRAANVLITNTQLASLNGIDIQTVDTFNINNNLYLTQIETQLGNISKSLTIEANGRRLTASFPNLQWAFNMTFRNCSDVKLPSLDAVNGSMGFYENFFQSFAAPNLTAVGGSLVFDDNVQLTNISLPMLKTINGGYQIANNTQLKVIDGFQALQTVGGALDFSGNFTNVSLPALSDVRGGFNMQSSSPDFSCSSFDNAHNNQVVKGTYVCAKGQSKPGTAGSSPQPSGSSTPSAAGRFGVSQPLIVGGSFVVAGLLALLF